LFGEIIFFNHRQNQQTRMNETIVKTKDLGFQVSVRKTFGVTTDIMWDFLLSEQGIHVWLGEIPIEDFEIQKSFVTTAGIEGKLTVFVPNCHFRLKWKPKGWTKFSTIELRVVNAKGKAAVIFHQTGFFEIEQKEELRTYWKNVVEKMNQALTT
jgi:activator of HSP90 ATPase